MSRYTIEYSRERGPQGASGSTDASAITSGTLNAARLPATVVQTSGSYTNPDWLVSIPFTKVTGAATKVQQHAQTPYKDEANTWAQAQTFNGTVSATGFGVGAAVDASLPFRSLASSNATVGMLLNNTSSGSSASSAVIVESDAGQAGFRQYSLSHSVWPGTTVISSPSGGSGLAIVTSGASNPIEFHTNNTLRVSIGDSGSTFNGTVVVNNSGTGRVVYGPDSYIQGNASELQILQLGSGSLYQDFGTSVIFRRTSDFATMLTLSNTGATTFSGSVSIPGDVWHNGGGNQRTYYAPNSTSYHKGHGSLIHAWYDSNDISKMLLTSDGNLTTIGTVTSSGSRPVTLNGASGFVVHVGDSGGWAQGSSFAGPNGTSLAEIGIAGTNNSVSYGYIGPFASPWLKITSGGFLELPSSNRIFQDSGNLYIESDGGINLRDYSSGVSLWGLANDGRTFAKINVWHSDSEGNPRIVYNGSGGATNFYGGYDFVSSDRGHGLYSDGSIRWGQNQSLNGRGALSWDTDKASIQAPLNLDIISGGLTRYVAVSHEFNSIAKLGDYTVATLPSASAYTGYECNTTDSSVTTFGSTVAGGGSSNVKVRSNGTNWTVAGI